MASNTDISVVHLFPDGYVHMRAFDEIAEVVSAALEDLGRGGTRLTNQIHPSATNLILGSHILADQSLIRLPAGTIIYNFEQIDPTSALPPTRLELFHEFQVWDYSARNVELWQRAGIGAAHVPLGHHPVLERLSTHATRDIDVLFYGSMNERRHRVIEGLIDAGLRVEALFGAYGAERDRVIARTAAVINIHFYEARILETARLSFLFTNRVPVISEWSPDLEIPSGLEEAASFHAYDDLVTATVEIARDRSALEGIGERGRRAFAALPMTGYLEKALAA